MVEGRRCRDSRSLLAPYVPVRLTAFVAALLLLAGCAAERDFKAEFVAFGTLVSLSAYDTTSTDFEAAEAQIEQEFAAIGAAWYVRSPGELNRLNAAIAAGEAATVSAELQALLRRAAEFEQLSGGRFNVCLGALSELWGFYDLPDSPNQLPDAAAIERIVESRPGTAQFHWQDRTIRSDNPLALVDVGGIAKGAIINRGIEILRRHGIDNAILNIGGDLKVIGSVNGRDASIGIRSPGGDRPIVGLDVDSGEAVFTSGNYERQVVIDGKPYTHILDPANGYPVSHTASVTVVHPDPLHADAAATALLVGGAEEFDRLAAAFDLRYALLIDVGGDTRLTSAMAERLYWPDTRNRQQEPGS